MRILILIALVISGLTAVACSTGAPSPADTQTASRPTADVPATVEAGISGTREAETAVDATVEAKVAETLTTSASAPGPTYTSAEAILSLDVYLTLCAPPEQDLADDATYGDLSSEIAAEADRLEAITPPAQLSEWHLLNIEALRTIQAIYEPFPKDDVIDNATIEEFLLAIAPDLEEQYSVLEEKLSEIAVRLPDHLRQQMIEVDCLDPHIVPDDYDEPDDHGNNFESATRIAIGEAVAIELAFRVDKDVLVFLAEPGTEYEFTLDWEIYSRSRSTARPILALFDAGGQELAHLNHDVFGSQDKMMWQALTRGDYYIVVGDRVTHGSITLTVTDGEATEQLGRDDHGDSEGDATAIRVGADVQGELEYDGDFDYFSFQADAGWSYQIDVALGTLDDSIVELYDTDGSFLDSSDDYGNTYASRLSWRATSSGEKYVFVGGYGAGTYTLTVSLIDDHGNDYESATRIAIGEAVAVELENFDDIDVLVFRARPGTEFLLTLDWEYYTFRENYTEPPLLAVYSANGQE